LQDIRAIWQPIAGSGQPGSSEAMLLLLLDIGYLVLIVILFPFAMLRVFGILGVANGWTGGTMATGFKGFPCGHAFKLSSCLVLSESCEGPVPFVKLCGPRSAILLNPCSPINGHFSRNSRRTFHGKRAGTIDQGLSCEMMKKRKDIRFHVLI